jgi:uncharacterized protein YukE
MPYKTNQYGSIRKRTTQSKSNPKHYWEGRVTVGYDEHGKQIQRAVTAKTQKLLEQKLKQVADEVNASANNKASSVTLEDFISTWLTNFCLDLKESTRRNYRQTANKHIVKALGSVELNKLKT